MMNSTKKESLKNKNMYDVNSYNDRELLDILDLTDPTDRELEAKIIFLINKYKNIQNDSGNELAIFFEDIYSHFFETSDNDESIVEGMDDVGEQLTKEEYDKLLDEQPTNNDIMNKLNADEYLDTSKAKIDKVMNYTKEL